MWRCEKCETMNEDYYDSCLICHYEKNNHEKNNRTKTEISSSSFYDHWEKDPIPRKYPVSDRKSKNVLKVLVDNFKIAGITDVENDLEILLK